MKTISFALAFLTSLIMGSIIMSDASTQSAPKKIHAQDLYGLWEYVSAFQQRPDGSTFNQFGDPPRGYFAIFKNGHYSHIVMEPDLPHVASGLIKQMAADEALRIAEGTLAHFGTFTVDEEAGTFTVVIEKSSFPNFDGVSQTRTVTQLDKTTLAYQNPVSSAGPGNIVFAVLRRVGR